MSIPSHVLPVCPFALFLAIKCLMVLNRFTTPEPEHFNKMMRKYNIYESNHVVMYNGISAAKAWFIMKYYGHPNTSILSGGITHWKEHNFPVNTFKNPIDYSRVQAETFTAQEPRKEMLIDFEEVVKKIGGKLIDNQMSQMATFGRTKRYF